MFKHGHSVVKTVDHSKYFQVKIVPALLDNYIGPTKHDPDSQMYTLLPFIIIDRYKKEAAKKNKKECLRKISKFIWKSVVDPVDAERIKDILDEEETQYKLTAAFITHHHWDHAGGNNRLKQLYPDLHIYSGDERAEIYTSLVKNNQVCKVGNLNVCCLSTPCHTSGHISYYVTGNHNESPALFSGDSIFVSGCGKFFEGSAQQMYDNMQAFSLLPMPTRVYCGHELTVANLKFALNEEPNNHDLAERLLWAKTCRIDAIPTLPSTIEDELRFNPFMKARSPGIVADLRKRRDHFRSHRKGRESVGSVSSSMAPSPVDRSGAESASSGISSVGFP